MPRLHDVLGIAAGTYRYALTTASASPAFSSQFQPTIEVVKWMAPSKRGTIAIVGTSVQAVGLHENKEARLDRRFRSPQEQKKQYRSSIGSQPNPKCILYMRAYFGHADIPRTFMASWFANKGSGRIIGWIKGRPVHSCRRPLRMARSCQNGMVVTWNGHLPPGADRA